MKKNISFFIMIVSIIVLSGCGMKNGVDRQFNREFNEFKSKIENTNQVVMGLDMSIELYEKSVYLGKESVAATIKMNESPLYIDISTGNGVLKETYILSQKGDDLYKHRVINDDLVITEYYSSVDEYSNSEYDTVFDFTYNSKNGEVKKEDNYYIFSLKFEDTLTDDEKSYLEDVYDILSISLEDVLNTELEIKFKFGKNQLSIIYDMGLDVEMNNRNIQMKSSIEYDIKIEEFELIDLDSCEHISESMDSVYNCSKLNQTYNYHGTNLSYYQYNLEQGYYYIDRLNDNNDFNFTLYNSNKEKLDVNYLIKHYNNKSKYETIFEIKDSGTYYIKLENCNEPFALKKFNNDDYKKHQFILDEINEFTLKEKQFSFIDLDFSKEFISIENKGLDDIKIENLYNNVEYTIKPNEKCFIDSKKADNGLIVTNNSSNEICKLIVKEVEKKGNLDTPYEDLEEITNIPSNGFYYCDDNNNAIIKLIVEEEGYYTFYNTKDEISSKMYFNVEKIGDGYHRWVTDNTYLILPGEYLITMRNSFGVAYGNVYYEFESTDIQFNYELPVQTGKNPESSTFPTVKLNDNHGMEDVKYYFNIEEECVLFFNGQNIYLHYENGGYVSSGVDGYFHLQPGKYYINSILDFTESGYEIKFGIVEFDKRDFELDLITTKSSNLETLRYLKNEQFPVTGYFRYWFTLEEDSKIIHDTSTCKIYDENHNMITTDKSLIELSSGRYYVTFQSNIVKIYQYIGK